MHIAYLISGSHSGTGGGGAESYVITMADALQERGHRVSIVALESPSGSNADLRVVKAVTPNLHWFIYRALPFGKSLAMPVREFEWSTCAWNALAQLHRQNPVDVVETGENLALQQLGIGRKPPVVIRGHGNGLSLKKYGGGRIGLGDRLARRAQLKGIRRAHALTAVSKFQAKDIAADLSVPEDSIQVIPNPISPLLLQKALELPPVKAERPSVLYTGRIEKNKGTLELLQSVNFVAANLPEVEYVIAGARDNSIDDRTLQNVLAANGAREHIRFAGHVPWNALADVYRRTTVFAMPSYYETFGISVIEAMAFGLPVVASNAGGLPEIVEDGVTGLLVPAGDSQALAEALLRLLRDEDLCARMGRAGQERVQAEFTVDRIVPKMLAVYESVIRTETETEVARELTKCAS